MLPAGLRLLMRLQARGILRKFRQGLRSPRKAAILILMLVGPLVALTAAAVLPIVSGAGPVYRQVTAEQMAGMSFTLLLLSFAGSMFQMPLVYTASEIQFLFPAPFSRRQLMAYKLMIHAGMVTYLSVFFGTMLAGISAAWPRVVLATLLLGLLALGGSVTTALLMRLRIGRFLVLTSLAALIVAAIVQFAPAATLIFSNPSPEAIAEASGLARSASVYRGAVALMMPFAAVAAIEMGPWAFVLHLAAAAGMAAASLAAALALDLDLHEHSIEASRRREAILARLQRGRIGRGAWGAAARVRVPMPPRLGGFGPTLHRHLVSFLRERSTVYILLAIAAVPLAGGFYLRTKGSDSGPIPFMGIGGAVYATFILSSFLRFDFRGDYFLLDHLKTMPLRPLPLAAGAVAAPALIIFFLQSIPVVLFAIASGIGMPPLNFLLLLLPANLIYFAVDNAIYLRAPTPVSRGVSANPSAVGREMISMAAKGLVLMLVGGVAAGAHLAVLTASDNTAAAWIATWLVVAPAAVWFVFLTGVAFRNLDLGRDQL